MDGANSPYELPYAYVDTNNNVYVNIQNYSKPYKLNLSTGATELYNGTIPSKINGISGLVYSGNPSSYTTGYSLDIYNGLTKTYSLRIPATPDGYNPLFINVVQDQYSVLNGQTAKGGVDVFTYKDSTYAERLYTVIPLLVKNNKIQDVYNLRN